ncbi:MAG TPA: hypothetical protein VFZ11_09185 [Gemmatimonadaceae bacterium]
MPRRLILSLLLALVPAAAVRGQTLTRAHLDWRTVETAHFVVHYPAQYEAWTRDMASRLEPVHEAVTQLVGFAPPRKVTIVVDDPYATSNGSAWPFLDRPAIFLWPTPPSPRASIGHNRSWGEILAVHEFAHLAHLTRPSRSRWQRFLWRLSPAQFGPIMRKAPRWVTEGYATYIEGELTGSGRPHGAFRAAVLRQWALEGKLPTYGRLGATDGFLGGSFAYLVGSAYLEWLVERGGDSSLVHLWRRMSARQDRSFDEAFAGVFGGYPADLYGRFTTEVTANALAIAGTLREAGLDTGEVVQRLQWYTGDPAVSRDGSHLAIVLRAERRPSRLVVWSTAEEPEDSAVTRARARMLERDPEDVPAIEWRPRPKRALATLHPFNGLAPTEPRWLPDGRSILFVRAAGLPDGSLRPDLFVWEWERGDVRRVTHAAGIRSADPSPDGAVAVAEQCLDGSCDLVRVDLRTGAIAPLATAGPTENFTRPRWSPDGLRIATAVQSEGRWRVAVLDADGRGMRFVGPDDGASRYDPAFLPGGEALVVVSERGGIPNLERLAIADGATQPLSRVTSAAAAPDPAPDGSLFFLLLQSKGWDLQRRAADAPAPRRVVAVGDSLAPAAPPAAPARPAFERTELSESRPYGLGPGGLLFLPGASHSADGSGIEALVLRADPVGRLSWLLQGRYGEHGTWKGASFAATWRGMRPTLTGDLFLAEHEPSRRADGAFVSPALDHRYTGGTLLAELERDFTWRSHRYRLGGSAGRLEGAQIERTTRSLGFGELLASYRFTRPGDVALLSRIELHGSAGRTADEEWTRGVAALGLGYQKQDRGIAATVRYGATPADAPPYEQFVLGGARAPLVDEALVTQRIEMPALPFGIAGGRRVLVYRGTLALGGLEPYYWGASFDAGDGFDAWHRVVGAEMDIALPAFPFLRTPAIDVRAGVGYSLDEPFRKKTRLYSTVVYRP